MGVKAPNAAASNLAVPVSERLQLIDQPRLYFQGQAFSGPADVKVSTCYLPDSLGLDSPKMGISIKFGEDGLAP
jgi:hypothetical protein